MFKLDKLQNLGYSVVSEWECEFKQFLKRRPSIDNELCLSSQVLFPKLNPRDAVYGGRVEVFRLYHKVKQGEKIRYIDFTSLYPFCNWHHRYSISHPTQILLGKQCENLKIKRDDEGFIFCKILAPRSLFIPVLPYRSNNKLLFPLCAACANTSQVTPCNHTDNQRVMYGTWPICEVKLAMREGYKVLQIIEYWTYKTIKYDKETKTGGLFTDFMKTFLKIKLESSGWPSWATTLQAKENWLYITSNSDDIQLDPEKNSLNPSYRSLSKLMVNGLWGKLTQKDNKKHTDCIKDVHELYELINSPLIEVIDIYFPNENTAWVCWQLTETATPVAQSNVQKNLSITTGAYTTAHARRMLYKELKQINNEILYCDTDSLIYIEKPNMNYHPNTGSSVGMLTNELEHYGLEAYIDEFVSIGPKSYSLRIKNASNEIYEISKCKGFQSKNSKDSVLNFENFKKMISTDHLIETNNSTIRRIKHFKVITDRLKKKFGFTFDKRVCLDNFITFPYGPYGYKEFLSFPFFESW